MDFNDLSGDAAFDDPSGDALDGAGLTFEPALTYARGDVEIMLPGESSGLNVLTSNPFPGDEIVRRLEGGEVIDPADLLVEGEPADFLQNYQTTEAGSPIVRAAVKRPSVLVRRPQPGAGVPVRIPAAGAKPVRAAASQLVKLAQAKKGPTSFIAEAQANNLRAIMAQNFKGSPHPEQSMAFISVLGGKVARGPLSYQKCKAKGLGWMLRDCWGNVYPATFASQAPVADGKMTIALNAADIIPGSSELKVPLIRISIGNTEQAAVENLEIAVSLKYLLDNGQYYTAPKVAVLGGRIDKRNNLELLIVPFFMNADGEFFPTPAVVTSDVAKKFTVEVEGLTSSTYARFYLPGHDDAEARKLFAALAQ